MKKAYVTICSSMRNNKMSKELYKQVRPAIAAKPKKPLARMNSSVTSGARTSWASFSSSKNLKNRGLSSDDTEEREDSLPSSIGSSRQSSAATGKSEV